MRVIYPITVTCWLFNYHCNPAIRYTNVWTMTRSCKITPLYAAKVLPNVTFWSSISTLRWLARLTCICCMARSNLYICVYVLQQRLRMAVIADGYLHRVSYPSYAGLWPGFKLDIFEILILASHTSVFTSPLFYIHKMLMETTLWFVDHQYRGITVVQLERSAACVKQLVWSCWVTCLFLWPWAAEMRYIWLNFLCGCLNDIRQ